MYAPCHKSCPISFQISAVIFMQAGNSSTSSCLPQFTALKRYDTAIEGNTT
jgi:hypothetical protein